MEDRRRSPRQAVQDQSVAVYAVETVQVLELSANSVLLQSPTLVEPGPRGVLRLSMDGAPFAAEVEIRRVTPAPVPADGFRVAAQFLTITPKHRQLIERFISQ